MTSETRDGLSDLLGSRTLRTPGGLVDEAAVRTLLADVSAQGWTSVGLAEDLGGSGGDLVDATEVAAATAYCAAPLPLADAVLGAVLLGAVGLALPEDASCVVPATVRDEGAGRLTAAGVAWASRASHLLVLGDWSAGGAAALVPIERAVLQHGTGPAGFPQDVVELQVSDLLPDTRSSGADPRVLARQLGALIRAAQIAASMERVVELTVGYVGVRQQFGRPLGRLPVVQHELAALAGESAAAVAAAAAAVRTVAAELAAGDLTGGLTPAGVRAVAAAKVRTGQAATAGSRLAHQLHGAMGITREYELHAHSLALWTWRDEYGAESEWAARLGTDLVAAGGVWTGLTSS